jgi:hypothetical protein
VVWHHRRFTLAAYLKQQSGYGQAEAQLMKKHPLRFGVVGGARWRGLIYGDGSGALPPQEGAVFHGPFGTGAFQVIYATGAQFGWWQWMSGVLWVCITLMLLALGWGWMALGLTTCASLAAASTARRHWKCARLSKPQHAVLLWLMCLLQPIAREWARVRGMWKTGARPSFKTTLPDIIPPLRPRKTSWRLAERSYWSATGRGREEWLAALRQLLAERKMQAREDDGWRWFDMERSPIAWLTVTEYHGGPRRLTRVRLLLRLDWRWKVGCAVLLAGVASFSVLGTLALTIAMALAVVWQRQLGLSLLETAASRAGLQEMT